MALAHALDENGNLIVLRGDGTLSIRSTIEAEHAIVHKGDMYMVGHRFEDVADDASVTFLITIGADKEAHAKIAILATGACRIDFYEGLTYTGGSAVTVLNNNRGSSNNPDTTCKQGGTISNTVTTLPPGLVPGATKKGQGGGSARENAEIILTVSGNYGLDMTNKSGGATDILVFVEFYEEEV